MTDQQAKVRAAIARQQAIRALPPHNGTVEIKDPRYVVIAAGLQALYDWNCRKCGKYRISAADVSQKTVDPELIGEAVVALHGPRAAPTIKITRPEHNLGDWSMAFELPCDLCDSEQEKKIKKFEHDGNRYVVVPHDDGNFSLSEDIKVSPILIVGTWDQVTKYIRTHFAGEVVWLD